MALTPKEELIAAKALLTSLVEHVSPLPWGQDGHEVYCFEGPTILTPEDPYPRGDNHPVENAELVARMSELVPSLLRVLDAAIRKAAVYEMPEISEADRDKMIESMAASELILARAILKPVIL